MTKDNLKCKVFDEKTGNPRLDNLARTLNRAMRHAVRTPIRLETPGLPRKRKKHVTKSLGLVIATNVAYNVDQVFDTP